MIILLLLLILLAILFPNAAKFLVGATIALAFYGGLCALALMGLYLMTH